MAVPKHVLGALSLLLLVVVALVALGGDSSSHTTSDKPTVTHLTSAPSTTYLASDPTACAGPTWTRDTTSLPTITYPANSYCDSGLWADNADGSIRSFSLSMTPENQALMNANPRAKTEVPCNFTIVGATSSSSVTLVDAGCSYKGALGSLNCVSADGSATPASPTRDCKLSLKIKLKHATNYHDPTVQAVLDGSEKVQFSGVSGEFSQINTPMGYMMLNAAGFISPCSKPANVFVNGVYNGIMANTENPDRVMLERRARLGHLGSDDGRGTLFKETWPVTSNSSYYYINSADELPHLAETSIIPSMHGAGLNSPAIKEYRHGDRANNHTSLFFNLAREAEACVSRGNAYCTKERAAEILDRYTDANSFINGMVGLALTGNVDSVWFVNHNYMMYVYDNSKLFYVAWDLDDTLAANIKRPGWKYPWYGWNFTAFEYEALCAVYPEDMHFSQGISPEPGYSPGFNTGQFGCNPASNLMARAWKDRFHQKFLEVAPQVGAAVHAAISRWDTQIRPGIECAEQNGIWPSVAQQQAGLYGSAAASTGPGSLYFAGYGGQPPVFSTGTSLLQWWGYNYDLWTRLAHGDSAAWDYQAPVWPGPSMLNLLTVPHYTSLAMSGACFQPLIQSLLMATPQQKTTTSIANVIAPRCMPVHSSSGSLPAQCEPCGVFFQSCFAGLDDCSWISSYAAHFAPN